MKGRRRDLLIVGGVLAAVYGLRALPWDSVLGGGPEYVDVADLPPFRRLATQGNISSASAPFVGIEAPTDNAGARRARAEAVRSRACPALFGTDVPDDVVPIAYFSEFRCPFCRALERDLDQLLATDPGAYRIIQHELPIFGPPSELAARASVAAARQGKQQELRRRFMRVPLVADPDTVLRVATDVGLDGERLARDMDSPEVRDELQTTRALADLFGFFGTPGLVIGRTALNGAVPYALLRQIAEEEKAAGPRSCGTA